MAKTTKLRRKRPEPTLEPSGGTVFPSSDPPSVIGEQEDQVIVDTLTSYFREADEARKGGLNPRDQKWEENLNLYWNRNDFSRKAKWQARETMPEVPSFVDRFAAALKEALVATPEGFYTVVDPADREDDMTAAVKRVMDVWLSTAGRNQIGQLLSFSSVFEEQMKLGALMTTSSVVTWKNDTPTGRVAVETVDPRFIWLDPTYRNLYRIRRTELDRHELYGLANQRDAKGRPVFKLPEVHALVTGLAEEDRLRREEMSGSGAQTLSPRRTVALDEYIATVVGTDGEVIADRALFVVANGKHLIRGPEKNPFWHGKDWITYAPLVTAPLSPYGRSYMEDFGAVAKTFTELTNMILDAVHTTSLKAYAMVPSMLLNPQQVAEGISPNKIFMLEEGFRAEDFAKALDLGTLPAESITVWQSIKQELSEAAGINEIGLGQFAPKGRTSATEIMETQQSSSALIRSVAQTVETRYLDPTLDLMWKTGLQHADVEDKLLAEAAGPDMWMALHSNRRELVSRPVTFQARGISALIARSQQLKALLSLMSVVSQNDLLVQKFFEKVDMGLLIDQLFKLSNIDVSKLQVSAREQMIRSVAEPLQQAAGAAGVTPNMNGVGA